MGGMERQEAQVGQQWRMLMMTWRLACSVGDPRCGSCLSAGAFFNHRSFSKRGHIGGRNMKHETVEEGDSVGGTRRGCCFFLPPPLLLTVISTSIEVPSSLSPTASAKTRE